LKHFKSKELSYYRKDFKKENIKIITQNLTGATMAKIKSLKSNLSFSQNKKLRKVPIFFTHRLANTKICQKGKKKVGVVIKNKY
jgi:hypothetical protein